MKRLAPLLVLALAVAAFAQTTTQPVPSEVDALRAQVAQLQAQVADLQKQLAAGKKPVVTATTRPAWMEKEAKLAGMTPIERAIVEHTLVNGMTLPQVDKSLGVSGITSGGMDRNDRIGDWYIEANPDKNAPAMHIRAHLVNGVVVQWSKM